MAVGRPIENSDHERFTDGETRCNGRTVALRRLAEVRQKLATMVSRHSQNGRRPILAIANKMGRSCGTAQRADVDVW